MFLALAPRNLPGINRITLDIRVLVFGLALSVVCGVIVGLIPAIRILRSNLEATLRTENARNTTSHTRARTFEPLVGAQVALTLALLIASGLMLKSLGRLLAVPTGFDTANLMTVTLSLPYAKHAWSYNARFSERIVEEIERLPGIEAAGAIRGIPMHEAEFIGPHY
ncbi:MAG: hypothetical protein HY646_00355 [Acidobacteria bacterium]|nr:hypothetical protein [Acidobacteriota bacterium]